MNDVDNTYKQIIKEVLAKGSFKKNRTDVSTVSKFGVSYKLDNSNNLPILTTKKMDGYRWDSLVNELLWYLSGEEHVSNLKEKTQIWDEWSDENNMIETSYGRYWRRYPIPSEENYFDGESNVSKESEFVNKENGTYTFDQIAYVIDNIKNNPNSRRHIVTAWHPPNATVSKLPPCHYTFSFHVDGDVLNLSLKQRSGDVALGVPFNITSYCLLQRLIANETGLKPGKFHHSITDAHIYCGKGERADWWEENIDEFKNGLANTGFSNSDIKSWLNIIEEEAPEQEEPYDHIPGLLEQMSRTSYNLPSVAIEDKSIDDIDYEHFELKNYESHDSIKFSVAE